MEEESHIQGVFYDLDHMDYYVSLNKETLKKIKEGNIIKSKIVYVADKMEDMKKMVQKKLFILLSTKEERLKNRKETIIIRTNDKVGLKISNELLNTLIEDNPKDYEYRYDTMRNKIHFLINDTQEPLSEKLSFDDTFKFCEMLNKKEPINGDLFESEYINVYNSQ